MESFLSLAEVNDLRRRQAAGETITDDELRQAVVSLRQDRMTTKPQQRKKAAKVDAPAPSLFDLTGSEDDKE